MVADTLNNAALAAPRYNYPTGSFTNHEWSVVLTYKHNTYRYKGRYIPKQTNIELVGATPSGTHERQVYTWRNNGLKYQVTWRPNDPSTIRVQVISPTSGKVNLNTLLTRGVP
jgi:hypothetical protein